MTTPAPAPEVIEPGPMLARSIGRYRLCYELASGGMGKVFLARAEGAGGIRKLVALKTIHGHLAGDRAFVEMFLDEARIAAQITHPNVCSVFDVGVDGDTHFLAMELLVGEPLSRVLRRLGRGTDERRHPLFPAVAARIVADVCAGLHAAHELRGERGEPLGVVHRDVSPQNVFVNYDGSVRVVDFGIARATGRMTSTGTGVIKGKLSYISPEGLEHRLWDRRTDVWAAGVVLWELLVGRKLFAGDGEAQILMAVLQDEIKAPSALGVPCPPQLDEIVLRALSRNPSTRYATAREFERDLQRFCVAHTGGEPLGPPELGAWMERLFPAERIRWQEVVDQARAVGDGVPLVSPRLRSDLATPSGVSIDVAVDEERTGMRPTVPAPPPTAPPDTRATDASARSHTPRSALAVLAAAAVAAAGIAALVVPTRPSPPPDVTGSNLPPASLIPAVPAPPAAPEVPVAPAPAVPVAAAAPPAVEPRAVEPSPAPDAPPPAPRAVVPSSPRTPSRRAPRPAPAEAAPEATASGEPGTLTIAVPAGWADVFEGSQSLGRAPGRFVLPGGRHRLEVRIAGVAPGRRVEVTVPAGGTARVVVEAGE